MRKVRYYNKACIGGKTAVSFCQHCTIGPPAFLAMSANTNKHSLNWIRKGSRRDVKNGWLCFVCLLDSNPIHHGIECKNISIYESPFLRSYSLYLILAPLYIRGYWEWFAILMLWRAGKMCPFSCFFSLQSHISPPIMWYASLWMEQAWKKKEASCVTFAIHKKQHFCSLDGFDGSSHFAAGNGMLSQKMMLASLQT